MTTTFTHAIALRAVDTDVAGLVAFVRKGNHCGCDAVRHGGLVVHQVAGFDGPHQCRAYHVVREADGAIVDLIEESSPSAYVHATGAEQGFAFWARAHAETDEDIAAHVLAGTSGKPLDARRLRIDPHPAGDCPACL